MIVNRQSLSQHFNYSSSYFIQQLYIQLINHIKNSKVYSMWKQVAKCLMTHKIKTIYFLMEFYNRGNLDNMIIMRVKIIYIESIEGFQILKTLMKVNRIIKEIMYLLGVKGLLLEGNLHLNILIDFHKFITLYICMYVLYSCYR